MLTHGYFAVAFYCIEEAELNVLNILYYKVNRCWFVHKKCVFFRISM